jgi:hypothetical protein
MGKEPVCKIGQYDYIMIDIHLITIFQLKLYRNTNGPNTPAPTRAQLEADKNSDAWADDILGSPGARRPQHCIRSLQAEVDAYLVDRRTGSGTTLKFWQVCQRSAYYHSLLTIFSGQP